MTKACPATGQIVPATFVKEYDQVKPLWLVTIGFKRHGKTTYLAALTLMLEKLSIVLEDVFADPLDMRTINAIRNMRIEAKEGKISGPTDEQPNYLPLLLSMYNLPESGSRCLVMYDVAGETYAALDKTVVPAIRHCTTTWFLISLSDLPEDKEGKTITELFKVYRSGMEQMKVDLRDRNLVVVYTKADKEPSTRDVKDYLRNDPFQNLTLSSAKDQSLNNFSLTDYIADMGRMSDYLREYTRTRVESGAAFINMVKAQGMNLHFCVTSALGQGAEDGSLRLREDAKRFRVLDPFFWAIALDMQESARSFQLAVDGSDETTYRRALELWEVAANHGDVTTYLLGQTQAVAVPGQRPPDNSPRVDAACLIGPILEQVPPDGRLLLLTGNRILDLMDFYNTSWRDRLILVTMDESSTQEWPNTMVYRTQDKPDMVIDALLRA
jgi:hypothetical protein